MHAITSATVAGARADLGIRSKTERSLNLRLYRALEGILDNFTYINEILTNKQKAIIVSQAHGFVNEDLESFVERDPAAKGSGEYIFQTYSCFKAVMYYRIANALYYYSNQFSSNEVTILQQLARLISEDAKIKTGVEIHPAAKIGSKLVIDHGVGTVIGETCEIGRECYILQGVILGASGISKNIDGKRHPTLGDEVQIGAFAKILGPVTIGSNVRISPGCTIARDIPSNSKIIITNEYQIQKMDEARELESLIIYGSSIEGNERLCIFGNDFAGVSSGANLYAASIISREFKDSIGLTVAYDHGEGYLLRRVLENDAWTLSNYQNFTLSTSK